MASLAAAQAAEGNLRQKLQGQPGFRGVEIIQTKCMGPNPYELSVQLDSRATYDALMACPQTPQAWMGVPITFSITLDNSAALDALGAADVTSQDYANVVVGFMCVLATFMVGKIAVESIVKSRSEHFDPKGQPPAAVKAKESTMDGVIKLAVMGYSIYSLQTEVPELLSTVKGLLK